MSRQTDFHVIHYCMGEVITDNNDVREVGENLSHTITTELNSKLACTTILSGVGGSDYHCQDPHDCMVWSGQRSGDPHIGSSFSVSPVISKSTHLHPLFASLQCWLMSSIWLMKDMAPTGTRAAAVTLINTPVIERLQTRSGSLADRIICSHSPTLRQDSQYSAEKVGCSLVNKACNKNCVHHHRNGNNDGADGRARWQRL